MEYSFFQKKGAPKKSKASHPFKLKISLFLLLVCVVSSVFGINKELFVSPDGTGDGATASSPSTFQLALDQAHNIADTVFISLLEGTYDASVESFSYVLATAESEIIVIRGGFNSVGGVSQNAENTILDGGGTNQILNLKAQAENGVLNVFISNISFQNGFAHDDGNTETIDHGGAIMAYEGNADLYGMFYLEVDNCIFMNNKTASAYNGGAIYSNVTFKISHSSFRANEGGNGGAIMAYAGPLNDVSRICSVEKTDFHENKNTSNQGSSIWHGVTLEVRDCEFWGMEDESVLGNGSCIWGSTASTSKISRSLFKDLKVKYWGSAFQSFGGNAYIDNCIFLNNKAGEGGDGYGTITFYHNNAGATSKRITNCTFDENRSKTPTSLGGAIHNRGTNGDDFIVANCIFFDNGTSPVFSYSNMATIKNSITSDPYLGITDAGNNLTGDPLFSDMYKHLSEDSPCINMGLNSVDPEMLTDFDGNRRILSETIDIGAHEYNHKPDSIILSDTLLPENSGEAYVLGTLSAKDPDIEDTDDLLFSLLAGDGLNDADNDKFSIEGNSLITLENADFEQEVTWYIHVGVIDFGGLTGEASIEIKINNENDPVVVEGTITDQSAIVDESYNFSFEEDLFSDQDQDDILSYSSVLDDDSDLPTWLSFDGLSRSFSGTPASTDREILDIKIIASDNNGSTASVKFKLEVKFNSSIEEFIKENILVFPNPARERIIINIPDKYIGQELRVYDLKGILLQEFGQSNKTQIVFDVGNMPAGLYYLQLGNEEKLVTKFIVE